MSLNSVSSPYTTILGLAGTGLNNGDVYVGLPGQDPETNPKPVYWDAAGAIPAALPLDVQGGYIMRAGTPAVPYTAGPYSIRVRDRLGVQVFYEQTVVPPSGGPFVTVTQFGAVGNGVADDTAAIQAAIDYLTVIGSGTLYFPHGTFLISSGFVVTKPIMFIGEGNGFVANQDAPATSGTTIKWTSATAGKMLRFLNVNFGGWGMQRIWLDADSKAAKCLEIDSSSGGKLDQITCTQWKNIGVHLTSTVIAPCAWNTFTGLRADGVVAGMDCCIRLSGFASLGNACFNQFNNTAVAHDKNAFGIVLGGCDNNVFNATYINSNGGGGTGAGVWIDITEQVNFPSNDQFYRISAGPYGWKQPSGTPNFGPQIYGYALDNGEPLPSVGTSQLFYTTVGSIVLGKIGSIGHSTPGNNFLFDYTAPNNTGPNPVTLPNVEPDVNYEVIIFPRQQVNPSVTPSFTPASRTTSGFNMYLSSSPGGTTSWGIMIVRR